MSLSGQSGISIINKKNIQFSVGGIIDISSTRIIGVGIKRHNQKSMFIFGVYLPSDSNKQSYIEEIKPT